MVQFAPKGQEGRLASLHRVIKQHQAFADAIEINPPSHPAYRCTWPVAVVFWASTEMVYALEDYGPRLISVHEADATAA